MLVVPHISLAKVVVDSSFYRPRLVIVRLRFANSLCFDDVPFLPMMIESLLGRDPIGRFTEYLMF